MKIDIQKSLAVLNAEVAKLEKARGKDAIYPDEVGKMMERLVEVTTGCPGQPIPASVKSMKAVLKAIGREAVKADKDKDGQLDTKESKAMSNAARGLLAQALGKSWPVGRIVRTGC